MHRVRRHDQEGTLVAFRGDLLDLRQTEHTLVGEALRGSEQGLQAAAHLRVHLDSGHPLRLGAEALPKVFRIGATPELDRKSVVVGKECVSTCRSRWSRSP